VNNIWRNVPNMLTGLRLAAAPALVALLYRGADSAALSVFVFAGLTDAADGYLAKRFNWMSRFGRYLDPAADKLLMLVSFVTLTALGATPLWLTVLVIARDLAIVTGIALAHRWSLPVRVTPSFLGKVSTAVQVMYVGLMLVMRAFNINALWLSQFGAFAVAFFTLASWAGYAQIFLRGLSHRRSRPA
jgi:cardiolipin synthase (CMP-forming)